MKTDEKFVQDLIKKTKNFNDVRLYRFVSVFRGVLEYFEL